MSIARCQSIKISAASVNATRCACISATVDRVTYCQIIANKTVRWIEAQKLSPINSRIYHPEKVFHGMTGETGQRVSKLRTLDDRKSLKGLATTATGYRDR